jgi:hypothetical protein
MVTNMIQKIMMLVVCMGLYLTSTITHAQQIIPCATDELYVARKKANPQLQLAEQQANETIEATRQIRAKAGSIIYIPVVFHIIHNNGLENISQAQIMNQIKIINEDFRRKEGTPGFNTDPTSADVEIEFRLAQFDPNGNKSDGIIRVQSTATTGANDANVKNLSFWDSNRYLNIWVVRDIDLGSGIPVGNIVLGYAQFPWERSFRPTTDGVVVRADQIGVIGLGQVAQGGRTLTHEIGHWLGLFHTFQGGCAGGTSANCASAGDGICDTPPVAEASSGCQTTKNSCSNDVPDLIDQVRNYMDYSNGNCMNTFTNGQKARMFERLRDFRATLFANNPTYAGINGQTGNYVTFNPAAIKAPYVMNFEGNSFGNDGWKLNNFNNPNNGWQLTNTAAFEGNSSITMRNFTNNTSLVNGRDGFQSPEIDLNTVANPFIEFNFAYAQRLASLSDSLILVVSPDFGMTETRIFAGRGVEIATAPITSSEFIPTNTTQWRKVSINLWNFQFARHARFRFEFVNRRGNSVFIDNLSISNGSTSTPEIFKQSLSFDVWPNPANEYTTIGFLHTTELGNAHIVLKDIAGKSLLTIHDGLLSEGKVEFKINTTELSNGLYFIDFKSSKGAFSHKLLIN